MKFGRKVRDARMRAGMSQEELAKAIGVSLRTITNYEVQNRYPKQREVYARLARALNVDVNYLLTEDEEFVMRAASVYGPRGAMQAERLIEEVSGLFAGGELSEEDKDTMLRAIQDAYWDAKEKNRRFTPKRYL